MSPLRSLGPLVLTLALTNLAFGDIGVVPTPKPEQKLAPVKVVHGKPADFPPKTVAKIVIPRQLLPELKKAAVGASRSDSAPPGGTIIAGLALSAAALSLILFFRKNRRSQMVTACLVGCVILVGGYALYADIKVPGSRPNPRPGPPHQASQIQIIVQEEGTEVVLTLPQSE